MPRLYTLIGLAILLLVTGCDPDSEWGSRLMEPLSNDVLTPFVRSYLM